jgi:hypothetical protein
MLISMVMIGIIAAIIAGVMRLSHISVEKGEKKIVFLEQSRATLGLIDSQIQSAFLLMPPMEEANEEGGTLISISGNSAFLRFPTNISLWSGKKGYVLATYRVTDTDERLLDLVVTEQTPWMKGTRETRLLQGFDEIYFRFFYKGATDEKGKWSETLPDSGISPEKILLHLKKGIRTFDLIIPLRAPSPNMGQFELNVIQPPGGPAH